MTVPRTGPGDLIVDGPIFNDPMPPVRTMDFQDANGNGIDDRDEVRGGPAPMPGGPVVDYPEQRLPGGGRILDRIFWQRKK